MINRNWIGFIFLLCGAVFAAEPQGEETYQISCYRCHALPYAKGIGAPAAHDKKAWQLRLKEAKQEVKTHPDRFKTPYDYLLYQVLHGKKLMVHGGLCAESTHTQQKYCTDEALMAAIHYMSQ